MLRTVTVFMGALVAFDYYIGDSKGALFIAAFVERLFH
jgi:hypothetical protein